jgi:hypothetical protein
MMDNDGLHVPNEGVQKLIDALIANGWPTPAQIRKAMALAYEGGRIDGSMETANNILGKKSAANQESQS